VSEGQAKKLKVPKSWRIELTRTAEKQITKLDRAARTQSSGFCASE
jgi:hypothetical protein